MCVDVCGCMCMWVSVCGCVCVHVCVCVGVSVCGRCMEKVRLVDVCAVCQ